MSYIKDHLAVLDDLLTAINDRQMGKRLWEHDKMNVLITAGSAYYALKQIITLLKSEVAPVAFKATEKATPENINTCDDDRWFIVVMNGDPVIATHSRDNKFKDSSGNVLLPEAWCQWSEV